MNKHIYQVQTDFIGGLDGLGKIKALGFETFFSAPLDLRGKGEGTNPEELLASAASTCYLITLAAILKFQGISVHGFKNHTEIEVENAERLRIVHIIHHPTIQLKRGLSLEQLEKIDAATQRAEKSCIIGQALLGNVSVSVKAKIEEIA